MIKKYMGLRELTNYIRQLSSQGYDYPSIQRFLLTKGFSQEDINKSIQISYYSNPQLEQFISTQLDKGIDKSQLKNYLLSYGYNPNAIDAGMSMFPQQVEVTHHHKLDISNKLFFIFGAVILVGLIGGGLTFYNPGNKTNLSELLDFEIDVDNTEFLIGNEVSFTYTVFNMGTDNRFDLRLFFDVLDEKGKIITRKSQQAAIETRLTNSVSIKTNPDFIPGKYSIRGKIKYGAEDVALAESETFKLILDDEQTSDEPQEKPEPPIDEPIVPDEPVDEPVDEPNETDAEPTGEYDNLTHNEIIKLLEDASDDLNKAAKICTSLSANLMQEFCYFELAKITNITKICSKISTNHTRWNCVFRTAKSNNDHESCKLISKDSTRDNCYREIALNTKNSELCDKIDDEFNRNSCYLASALTNKDFGACEKITNNFLMDSCKNIKYVHDKQTE
jgi:hypothetical protein